MLELSLFSSTYADLSGTDSRMVKSTSGDRLFWGQPGYKYASRSFVKLIGETFEFTCPNVLISFLLRFRSPKRVITSGAPSPHSFQIQHSLMTNFLKATRYELLAKRIPWQFKLPTPMPFLHSPSPSPSPYRHSQSHHFHSPLPSPP